MTIVKFKNGAFGVRKGIYPFYQYLGTWLVEGGPYWWTSRGYIERNAQFTNKKEAETMMSFTRDYNKEKRDYGTPIDKKLK